MVSVKLILNSSVFSTELPLKGWSLEALWGECVCSVYSESELVSLIISINLLLNQNVQVTLYQHRLLRKSDLLTSFYDVIGKYTQNRKITATQSDLALLELIFDQERQDEEHSLITATSTMMFIIRAH